MADFPLLDVQQLSISYKKKKNAVHNLSFTIKKGETLGIVGESGSGKSTAALALLRLLPKYESHLSGAVLFNGENLLSLPERDLQKIRGKEVGFIFQDALAALNPTMTVGKQIVEAILQHESLSTSEAKARALALMESLGISDPIKRYGEYPFQFSGGMCQRVVIAIAMASCPQLIIADEPTTALDESIQEDILTLLCKIQKESGMSLLLISHDLQVIKAVCHRVLVMHEGIIVEEGPLEAILKTPQHPYTKRLLESASYNEAFN